MVTMTAPPQPDHDPEQDDDAVFRQIVAGFGDAVSDPVPRWPVSEDLNPESEPPTDPRESGPRDAPPAPQEALPGWLEPAALPDEGHFVPPAPPRLPRVRLRTVGAIALLIGGFAALFFPFHVGLDDSPGSLVIGSLLVAAGLAVLIGSMRDAPGPDDRPDGGAVV